MNNNNNEDHYEEILLTIKKWGMDETEIKVFKLCLLWELIINKEFKDESKYYITKLRKTGDPRKSTLFRYCWKLHRETKGLIPNNEYKLYMLSQIQVFKKLASYRSGKDTGPTIDAQILCGPKAWRRWMYWRNLYYKQVKVQEHSEQTSDAATDGYHFKISEELSNTKNFLEKQANGPVTKDFIAQICSDRTLLRWVAFGKVSPYYILLSPFVKSNYPDTTFDKVNNLKLGIKTNSISDFIENIFKECFNYEFE